MINEVGAGAGIYLSKGHAPPLDNVVDERVVVLVANVFVAVFIVIIRFSVVPTTTIPSVLLPQPPKEAGSDAEGRGFVGTIDWNPKCSR